MKTQLQVVKDGEVKGTYENTGEGRTAAQALSDLIQGEVKPVQVQDDAPSTGMVVQN